MKTYIEKSTYIAV